MTEWRAIVLEDDPTVAEIHRRVVNDTPGFTVVGMAETTEKATRLIANLHPDLMLLDLMLPGRDGVSLLRALRVGGTPIEVVAVTASASSEVVRATVHLGVVDYLVKPFTPDRLRRALGLVVHRLLSPTAARLAQEQVDALCASGRPPMRWLPKDLSVERVDEVRRVLAGDLSPLSAEEVARRVGVARVTARRYLEYLVAIEEAAVDQIVDGPGRPRKGYRRQDGVAGMGVGAP